MTSIIFNYHPVLRLKEGEYRALGRVTPSVRDRITPCFILPPPQERDVETKRVLSTDEFVYSAGRRVGMYWPRRTCFIDARFLFKDLGDGAAADWLPRIFKIARDVGGQPIPLASLQDITATRAEAFKSAMPLFGIKMGVRVSFGDLGSDLKDILASGLNNLGVGPAECVIFLDFADADLSDPQVISEFLVEAVETLQELGRWSGIVFQGTHYPEKNPAASDATASIPRNEWLAWNLAIKRDINARQHLSFGDYGADCAQFIFKSGGMPIPHYRYCADNHWLVARGEADVKLGAAMKKVSEKIVTSPEFKGRGFSVADEYIYQTSVGMNAGGNAATWRQMNTIHHLTMVIVALGSVYGYEIEEVEVPAIPEQIKMEV